VHEESTEIAGQALRAAAESSRNLVLDGTGDSGIEKLGRKVAAMRASGATVEAHYVTIPTETAVDRAKIRLEKTGRGVPSSVIRENHAAVSAVFPVALAKGLFDRATLWDNSSGSLVKVLSHDRGETTVHRPDLYKAFLKKNPYHVE
jgi:predicted ABC-type ATPase